MKKLLFFMLPIIVLTTNIVASYEYDLANMLDETLVIKINQKRVDNKDYYQIIPPGKTVKQVFDNAYCLERLSWALLDKNAPKKGGLELVNKSNLRIPEEKQREFGDKIAPHYTFIPMEIIVQPNEVFKKTRKAAADLLKGIDSFACQTIDSAKMISQMASGSPSLDGGGMGGGLFGGGTGGSPFGGGMGSNSPLSSSTSGDNPFGGESKNNIDTDGSVINTSMDMGMGGGMYGGDSQGAKKCDFGLGKIASASGKLAGYTLCKSREFIIYFKTDSDGKPIFRFGKPILTATTVEGQ